jgi:hypothetical protein
MLATITALDDSGGVTQHRYHYTRTVRIAGHTVRARVVRDFYPQQSCAVAEVLADTMTTWTHLADDDPCNWFATTPSPRPTLHTAAELGAIAEQLLHRAAEILTPPTEPLPPHVLDAVSALLATTRRYDGEHHITAEEITWAQDNGGPLHILTHQDGSVTLTKAHLATCRFLTSNGAQNCAHGTCWTD